MQIGATAIAVINSGVRTLAGEIRRGFSENSKLRKVKK
jgi:hypothetical protein